MLILSSPDQKLRSIAWHADGERLIAIGEKGQILLWDVFHHRLLDEQRPHGPKGNCSALATSRPILPNPKSGGEENDSTGMPDPSLCLTGGKDKIVRLWKVEDDLKLLFSSEQHLSFITSLAFSPANPELATGSGYRRNNMKYGESRNWRYAFSRDSEVEVVQCAQTREKGQGVIDIAFSPDGNTLIMSTLYFLVGWKRDPQGAGEFEDESSIRYMMTAQSIDFSPNGDLIAGAEGWKITICTSSFDHRAQFKAELKGHQQAVRAVCFSPDGSLLASGAYDDTVKLWETENFMLLATYHWEIGHIEKVAFSPNGLFLAACGKHHVVIWEVDG